MTTTAKKKGDRPNAISVVVRVRPLDVNPQGHLLSLNPNNSGIHHETANHCVPLDPSHTNVLMLTTDKVGFSPVVTVLTQQQARDSNNIKLGKGKDGTAVPASPQLSLPSFSGGMGAGGSKGRQWPTFTYDSCFGPAECYHEYRTYFPLTSNIVAASPALPLPGGVDDEDDDTINAALTESGAAAPSTTAPSTSTPESNDQEDVYNRVGIPALRTLFKGYNSSVIAYGQTGSGKTYSMFGPADLEKSMGGNNTVGNNSSSIHNHTMSPQQQQQQQESSFSIPEVFNHPERGLIIRIAEALFHSLLQKQDEAVHHTNGEGFFNFEVTCSFYQIYREKAWELLPEKSTSSPAGVGENNGPTSGKSGAAQKKTSSTPTTTAHAGWSSSVGLGGGGGVSELAQEMLAAVGVKPLRLRSTDATGAFLEGLRKVPVKTPAELVALLHQGMSNRQVAATHLNMHSSRSHALCSINLKCRTNIGFAEVAAAPTSFSPQHHHHHPKVSKTELRTCNCTLHLVDLAGSERVGMLIGGDAEQYSKVLGGSGAGNNNDTSSIHHQKHHADAKNLMKSDAQRFKEITDRRMLEASDINKSLSALGKVIHALATAQEHQQSSAATRSSSTKKVGAAAAPRAKSGLPKGTTTKRSATSSAAYSRTSTGTSSTPHGSRTTSPCPPQKILTPTAAAAAIPHIPYRDSILTHLLKDCFGGNSSTFMLATISPMMRDAEETLSTLRFSSKARSIENVPKNTAKKMKLWSESTASSALSGNKKKRNQNNKDGSDTDDDNDDDDDGSRPNTARSTTSQSLTPRRRELRDHKARLLALENAELQENLKMFKQEIQVLRDEISRLAKEVECGGGSRSRAASLAYGSSVSSPSLMLMGGGGGGGSSTNIYTTSQQQQQMAVSSSNTTYLHHRTPALAQERAFNHNRQDYMTAPGGGGVRAGGGQTVASLLMSGSTYKVSAPDSFLSSSPLQHQQQPDELVLGYDDEGGDGFEGSPSPPAHNRNTHEESANKFEQWPADEYEVMRAMADRLETTEVYLKQLEAENAQFRRTVQQQESERKSNATSTSKLVPPKTVHPPQRSSINTFTSSSTTAPPKVRVLVRDPEMCEGEAGWDDDDCSLLNNKNSDSAASAMTPSTATTTATSYPDVWLSRHSPASTPRSHSASHNCNTTTTATPVGTRMADLGSPILSEGDSGTSLHHYNATTPPPPASHSVLHQLMNNTLPPNHHLGYNIISNINPTGLVQSRPQSPSVRRGVTPTRQTRFTDDHQNSLSSTAANTYKDYDRDEVSLHRLHLDTPHPAAKPNGARYATIGNPRLLKEDDDDSTMNDPHNLLVENNRDARGGGEDSLLHLRGTINDLNFQLLSKSPSGETVRAAVGDVPLDQLVRQHHATSHIDARPRYSSPQSRYQPPQPSSPGASHPISSHRRHMETDSRPPPQTNTSNGASSTTATRPPPPTRHQHSSDNDSSDSSSEGDGGDSNGGGNASGNALIASLLSKVSIENVRVAAMAVGMKPSKIEKLLAQHRGNIKGVDGDDVAESGSNRNMTNPSSATRPAVITAASATRGYTSSPEPRLPSSGGTARAAFTSTTAVPPGGNNGVTPTGRNPQLTSRRGVTSPTATASSGRAAPTTSSRQPTTVIPKRRGLSPSQLPLQRLPVASTSPSRKPTQHVVSHGPSSSPSRTPINNNNSTNKGGSANTVVTTAPTIASRTSKSVGPNIGPPPQPPHVAVTATAAPIIVVRRQGGVSNRVVSPQPGKRIIN